MLIFPTHNHVSCLSDKKELFCFACKTTGRELASHVTVIHSLFVSVLIITYNYVDRYLCIPWMGHATLASDHAASNGSREITTATCPDVRCRCWQPDSGRNVQMSGWILDSWHDKLGRSDPSHLPTHTLSSSRPHTLPNLHAIRQRKQQGNTKYGSV